MGTYDREDRRKGGPRRNPARNPANRNADIEFINRELSVEETAAYRSWRADAENVFVELTELVEGEYRVTIKYDDYSSSCAVFIFPGPDSENSGYALTGRGGNAYRALSEALFKHVVVFKGVWSVPAPRHTATDDPEF